MKNVTISMDEELHRLTRVQAAKQGLSMSRYVSELVERDIRSTDRADENAEAEKRLAALKRFLSGPKLPISENGRMPTSEERNAGLGFSWTAMFFYTAETGCSMPKPESRKIG